MNTEDKDVEQRDTRAYEATWNQAKPRPVAILEEVNDLIPNRVWTEMERLRTKRRNRYPKWCFLPFEDCFQSLSRKFTLNPRLINILHPIGTWRFTQGIYRMNNHLLKELTKSPFSGDIPVDVLVYLPEWCVYVQLPVPAQIGDSSIIGFFAMMSLRAAGAENPYLYIMWDYGHHKSLDIDAIELSGTIEQSVDAFIREKPLGFRRGSSLLRSPFTQADRQDMVTRFNLAIPILLYLASVGRFRDIRSASNEDAVPVLPKGKLTPPKEPQQWNVGWRIGPALNAAKAEEAEGLSKGTHASPRPHIRRSHFRSCRVGHGRHERRPVWIPAVPVNFRWGPSIPVIRHVMDSKPGSGDGSIPSLAARKRRQRRGN